MNAAGLVQGALIGAMLGGGFNAIRQFTGKRSDRAPLPTAHANISAIDAELVPLLQELNEMNLVPATNKAEFQRRLVAAIGFLERLAAIEVQIDKQEIVASFHDYHEASQLALMTMQEVRAVEPLFEQPEMRMQFRDKATELQTCIGTHLNNISSECLQY